jgi:hypothetical protein
MHTSSTWTLKTKLRWPACSSVFLLGLVARLLVWLSAADLTELVLLKRCSDRCGDNRGRGIVMEQCMYYLVAASAVHVAMMEAKGGVAAVSKLQNVLSRGLEGR